MIEKELVAASTEPMILSLLTRGENYGYELIQEVKRLSGADPKFARVPMKGLISEAYGAERVKEISPSRVNPNIGSGNPQLFNGDTI